MLPDRKIKSMIERVDIHPFPILLMQEHERRFGTADVKKRAALIARQISEEKARRRKLLAEMKDGIRKMNDYNISQSGLKRLTKNATNSIHNRSRATIAEIQRCSDYLKSTNEKIIRQERLLKEIMDAR